MTAARRTVDVLPTPDTLATAVADRFIETAARATREHGEFIVALSGGTTPRALYERLASVPYAGKVDWGRTQILWSDERCVPPDDPASNYRMARETLLDHVPVVAAQIHRIHGETGAAAAAAAYELILRAVLRTPAGPPRVAPGARIDLVLLGVGDDGHTASLLPGLLPTDDANQWVAAVGATPVARVTLTPALINAAAEIVFVVSGLAKSAVVGRVVASPDAHEALPAHLIDPIDGRVRWMLDEAAAAALSAELRA